MNGDLKNIVEGALDKIRPFLKEDGGDVSLVEITEDMKVMVEFHGACKTCSMKMMTLKAGIEETVKNAAPQIKSVVAFGMES